MTRSCLKCEGRGVRRNYLDIAGTYTTFHCTACGGTGKEQTKDAASVLAYVEQRAVGWDTAELLRLTTELVQNLKADSYNRAVARLDTTIRTLLRDECNAIAGYIKQQ